ncbi:hypothetical protein LCGC14_1234810 [marine sediment metagenome]|uniref:Lambda phage tail tube protein N-terminal domain-containing protein n=1 Tax=marine sediment metagenome TaxID=412755 RepID=A0A0F9L7D4_9ZZZZ
MAVSTATIGLGTLLQRDDGASGWDTITEITNLDGPSGSLDVIDVTHMESADNYREFIAGLLDGGEVSMELQWSPQTANQLLLLTDHQARTNQNWRIVTPAAIGLTWTFSGFVTAYSPASPVDGKNTCSATIKITGKPALA